MQDYPKSKQTTVAELIAFLSKLPPDYEIKVDIGSPVGISNVKSPNYGGDDLNVVTHEVDSDGTFYQGFVILRPNEDEVNWVDAAETLSAIRFNTAIPQA